MLANPTPPPSLVSPAPSASNVSPDAVLTWQWVDNLINNGSFESGGLLPGWYTGGTNANIWQVYNNHTNAYGMGYFWATVYMPYLPQATGQLIQDIYIPPDATSATLQWKQRIWNLQPSLRPEIGRLRVKLIQGGVTLATLDSANGAELIYQSHTWVSRSTNLLAFAGQSFQLVFQADSYSTLAVNDWFVDIDGVSLSSQYVTGAPDYQVYLSKQPTLTATNLVADTTDLYYGSLPLAPYTAYYWRVAAVRNGTTNYSSPAQFFTSARVLPKVAVTGQTATGVLLTFPTLTNRTYTIEQSDSVGSGAVWYDTVLAGPGTGAPMQIEVPFPSTTNSFWRLKVSP